MLNTCRIGNKKGQRRFVAHPVNFVRTKDNSTWRSYRRGIAVLAALVVAGGFQAKGQDAVCLPVFSASASADDGDAPANTLDGWLSTRWSAQGDGLATDQSVSGPRLNITRTSVAPNGPEVKLSWNDMPGAISQVQVSSNLVSWEDTGGALTNTGTTQTWEENVSSLSPAAWPKRFYRIKHAGPSAPSADFSVSSSQGVVPLTVKFTDRSGGNPVAWNWSFGDGATSTAQSPSYVYAVAGTYHATLTVRNSTGDTSTKTASIQAAALPPGGNLPSGVLNLANSKLTLPIDTSHAGTPDEIKQPELATFQDGNYFYVNSARDGVVFTANCGGYTTSGSGYPRSELREMTSNGSINASWSTTSGTHTMEIRQAITHLPVVKPQVVAGQIHDAGDDVIVFRLEGSQLFIDQNGVNGPVLTTNYRLGDIFTAKFVARNGGVECYYNGRFIYTYPVSDSGCYFKAGCYTQSNTTKGDAPTAYGQVVIYNVSITHQ